MDALILTCGTGGGHNSAAAAIAEELEKRGHHAMIQDPYALKSSKLALNIGKMYAAVVRFCPKFFGFVYNLGEIYRRLPIHSPVYAGNKRIAVPLEKFIREGDFNVIFSTNLFPEMMLAAVREKGADLPPVIFISTDYTCIPFAEEGKCDYCIIPSARLTDTFVKYGFDKDRLLPFGIPVREQFRHPADRDKAVRRLELNVKRRYYMLMGGSIGAGHLKRYGRIISKYMIQHPEVDLIIICGNNDKLYQKLINLCEGHDRAIIIQQTDRVADYMAASDVLISKPGGLSSTEAAVTGVPLIHIAPIPGCESKNRKFFSETGMSIAVLTGRQLFKALDRCRDERVKTEMLAVQRQEINPHAAEEICDLAIQLS